MRASLFYGPDKTIEEDTQKTMTYNVNGQLASLSWSAESGSFSNEYPALGPIGGIQYTYSATQNNGQITQATDTMTGETISYQYDALKRLTSASSTPISGTSPAPSAWTQTYQYDGFGNLTAKVLNGTTTPIAVNAATNQLSNAYYDANGNMTSGAGATLAYDVSNRVAVRAGDVRAGLNITAMRRIINVCSGNWRTAAAGDVLRSERRKARVFTLHPGRDAGLALVQYIWFGGKLIIGRQSGLSGPAGDEPVERNLLQLQHFCPSGTPSRSCPTAKN